MLIIKARSVSTLGFFIPISFRSQGLAFSAGYATYLGVSHVADPIMEDAGEDARDAGKVPWYGFLASDKEIGARVLNVIPGVSGSTPDEVAEDASNTAGIGVGAFVLGGVLMGRRRRPV